MQQLERLVGIDTEKRQSKKEIAKDTRNQIDAYHQDLQKDTELYGYLMRKPEDPIKGAKSHIYLINVLGEIASKYFEASPTSNVRWEPFRGFGYTVERFEFGTSVVLNANRERVSKTALWYIPSDAAMQIATPELIDSLNAQGKKRLINSLGGQTPDQAINRFIKAIR